MVSEVTHPPSATKGDKADERLGSVIGGRYRILRVLGKGGMGSVYEGVHTTTLKRVALKLLAGHLSKDLKLVARFRREAMAASRLEHENCVSIDDFGEDSSGVFYIAMELVEGCGLGTELRSCGPMGPARVARIGVQLLRALDCAHAGGVLHRDIKPQNIMVAQKPGRPDSVKVVDFGIAKITTNDISDQQALTIPGTIFGTPEYMSPEQARGEPLDARSDLYSASVVLWHLLLGRSPFRGTSVRDTLIKVFSEDAPTIERPGAVLPEGFEAVLRKGMAKVKGERWLDAASFAFALNRFAGDGQILDLSAGPRPGLSPDGSAPPPTLDNLPAVQPQRTAPARPSSSPVPKTEGPTFVATPTDLGGGPEKMAVLSTAPSPQRESLGHRQPAPLQAPVAASPPASPSPPEGRSAAPTPFIAPLAPAAAPKAPRVVTLDAVKREVSPGHATSVEIVPIERHPGRISLAATVVVACGLMLLVVFVVVAVLVVQGKIMAPPTDTGSTISTADSTAGPPTNAVIEPVAVPDPTALQTALKGETPLDPLARDAALGRAERAITENRPADARAAFQEAIEADPTAPVALAGLGSLAMRSKDWVTARDCFEKLISIDRTYRKQFSPMYARAKKLAEAPKE